MTHIEQARETFHIDDKTFSKVMDLMDEARAAIKKVQTTTSIFLNKKCAESLLRRPELQHMTITW